MSYIFRGRLCGYLCEDCDEPLADVIVRLYRHRKDQDVTARAVAEPGMTLALVSDDEVKAKASSLIAEATTDADGNFSFELGSKQKYGGEAFEIDVYCGNVPRRKPGRREPPPRQFTITTLQPLWKQVGESDFIAAWRYCLPWRFWCYIRSLFDAWVICGRLVTCGEGTPIPGAVVSAFDVDWLQDDPLGSGVTDAQGHFRIDYSSADFRLTPFSPLINVEWVGGPDVYFSATLGSATILQEDRSEGRTPGRQNVGHCFCVRLCSDKVIGPPDQYPHWNKVWDFSIHPDAGQVGSVFSTEGYAGGTSAFTFGDSNYRAGVLLRGNCPLTNIASPSHALQYRFVIGEYTWSTFPDDPTTMPSVAPGALVPVTQIRATTIGYVYYTDANNVFGPADVVITSADLDVNGWVTPILGKVVTVDMHDGTFAPVVISESNFLRTDELEVLNSSVISALHATKMPGGLPKADAGRALTNAEKEPIRRYKLQFEVRDATTLATVYTDTLSSIILDNSSVIFALDLEELRTNACNPVGGAANIHILYTVDHPHLSGFSMAISNNGGTVHGAPPLPSGSYLPGPNVFFRGGNGGPHNGTNTGGFTQNIAADPPCAYSLSLAWSTRQYLTGGNSTQILYCK
jgi:hypothetical protein